MKVLVTGVKGQLGHDVVNELEKRGHTAVGVELSGVYAVRQRGSGGRGRGGGRGGFFRGDRLGRALGGGRCGRTAARQQQGSESQGCELELFHAFLTSFYIFIRH